jgi:peptidoglycan hydrolase-like protein with peptidoglycan-binding domain
MTRSWRLAAIVAVLGVALVAPAAALAVGSSRLAAIQVGLRARHLYRGPIDGLPGPRTRAALAALEHAGIPFGDLVGPHLGGRPLSLGSIGGDVAELQFLLAWHGFPNGTFDGSFGRHTEAALLRFQRWAHVPPVGIAGPRTVAALRAPLPRCPIALAWPVPVPVGDRFGPRGAGFHPGIDLPAAPGTPVRSAVAGRVTFAGPTTNGYGKLVIVKTGRSVATMYAHLLRIRVRRGERVRVGSLVGRVGATGEATGPHLHFEVRVRGAAVDPLPALR